MQDIGVHRVKNMGVVINKGVDTYVLRSVPIAAAMMAAIAGGVYFVADGNFVIAMCLGALVCIVCTNLGINMNFEAGAAPTGRLQEVSLGGRPGDVLGRAGGRLPKYGAGKTALGGPNPLGTATPMESQGVAAPFCLSGCISSAGRLPRTIQPRFVLALPAS